MRVHILFEHGPDFRPFGSASIRLLRPLKHPSLLQSLDVTYGANPSRQPVDIVILDRLWRSDISLKLAQEFVREVHQSGAKLVYALDDDFFKVPAEHNVSFSMEQLEVVDFFLRQATCVFVTTEGLKENFRDYNENILVLPHALDESLIVSRSAVGFRPPWRDKHLEIGYMGTFTHDDDLLMILPALQAVHKNHLGEIEFQIIGGVGRKSTPDALADLPVRYIQTEPGGEEYPLFMTWFTSQTDWDIAIAPLRDTPFNQAKSDIKLLDYSAIGTAGIFSNVPAYQKSVVHLENGWLVDNQIDAWISALEALINDEALRMQIACKANSQLFTQRTLAQCSWRWQEALEYVMAL